MLAVGPQRMPVIVVDDPAAIRQRAGGRVDRTFTLTSVEAEMPRDDLARYLEVELRRAKGEPRQSQLRAIASNADRYLWYCGGYVRGGEKYALCSFVRHEPTQLLDGLGQKRFPVIKDGGTSVCECHFSIKRRRIVRIQWNGEA